MDFPKTSFKIECYSTPCINFLIGLLSTAINTAIPINTKPIVEKTSSPLWSFMPTSLHNFMEVHHY